MIRERNADLGRNLFEAFAVRTLVDKHPEIEAMKIHDITQGLVSSDFLQTRLDSIEDNEDLFYKLGESEMKEDTENKDRILQELSENILTAMSIEDIQVLLNIKHPKYILKSICDDLGHVLILKVDYAQKGARKATITCGDKQIVLEIPKGISNDDIERDACLRALNEFYPEEFKTFVLDFSNLISEDKVNIQVTAPKKREIVLTKSAEEAFGFTILGGEQKVIRNKEFIQKHIISPVFISEILPGSPAERCGLMVGDVLLGINDYSLQDSTHKEVVTTLTKFLGCEEVLFSVKHKKKELLKYDAEQRYLKRQKEKIREEIKTEGFSKWHEAKAKIDPEDYIMERLKEKRRPYQAKKIRQSRRLWDY